MAPDLRRNGSVVALALLVSLVVNGVIFDVEGNNNVVFEVEHKFKGRRNENGGRGSFLTSLKAHDSHRHGRMLAALDMPLGGNGSPTDAALVLQLFNSS